MANVQRVQRNHANIAAFLKSQELEDALVTVARQAGQDISGEVGKNVNVGPEPGRQGRVAAMITVEDWKIWQEAQTGAVARAVNNL